MPELVNREREIAELRALGEARGRRLVLLYGRRRVGKTFLLTRLWESSRAFYFTASAVTPEQNRRQLVLEAARWSGEEPHPEDYPTWRAVFRMLLSLKPEEPLVVVIDEFQYLAEGKRGLRQVASELSAVWERTPSHRPLLFVLSGSAVRTLEALGQGGSPLYGRFAWSARLEPFDYWDAARMVPGYDGRDQLKVYGAFGGMPRYLEPVDPRRSFQSNVASLLLSPRGEVRTQIETLIVQEEGLVDIAKYQSILTAIGTGRTRLSEIASSTGLKVDRALRDKVERLIDLGYVCRERNPGAPVNAPHLHRIADPAVAFYYAFVAPYETALEVARPAHVWRDRLRPLFRAHMGFVFERVVEQAYHRHRDDLDLPVVREWGRWEGADRNREPLEIDVVSELLDGRMLTGAVKHRSGPVGAGIITRHSRDLERLAVSGVRWAHRALADEAPLLFASAGGFTGAFHQMAEASGRPVIAWTLEDLFRGFEPQYTIS